MTQLIISRLLCGTSAGHRIHDVPHLNPLSFNTSRDMRDMRDVLLPHTCVSKTGQLFSLLHYPL